MHANASPPDLTPHNLRPDATPPPRWRRFVSGVGAALSSTAAHAPENAAYGLMAMAPLGAAFGPVAMGLALLGAALASATASLLGGGRLALDAGAALALLTTGLVAALLPLAGGQPYAVLPLLALAIVGAGLLQMLFGLLRLGGLVKFTPYPVRAGLSTGVGLLLVAGAWSAAAGHGFGAHGGTLRPAALLVSGTALGVAALAAWRAARVPPIIAGLGAATVLHHALALAGRGDALGPLVAVPALPEAWLGGASAWQAAGAALGQPAVWLLLGAYAATAAVIASLDTLLAASVVDGRLRRTRHADRELVVQGAANFVSAAVGGLPASPSIPASVGLVMQQPAQRHIVLFYAATLLLVLLLVPSLLGLLPAAAVGGVLVFLGLSMVSATLWQTPLALWRSRPVPQPVAAARRGGWRVLAANWAVTVAVAVSALVLGLGPAVLIGASCAVLLFVRANIRDVVRGVARGSERHSLKTRAPALAAALREHGGAIAVLELQGALFFGTADALRERLTALRRDTHTAIVDLRQVGEIDVTAARILCETAAEWTAAGGRLVFAEWDVQDPRRELLESFAHEAGLAPPPFEDSTDRALERAEDALLHRLGVERDDGALPLRQTTVASGFDDDELAVLSAALVPCRFARGDVLFHAGDPGDAWYVTLRGEIGLRLPGTQRRLASFGPGVIVGEMAVLAQEPRSADAVAESDVEALAMPAAAFDGLLQSHPQLAAKLMRNIALHQGDRVRHLTADLAGWVQRASVPG
jgi:SulP family sulfate permease